MKGLRRRVRGLHPSRMSKTAIVLFNLGGPDSQAAVRPFLFNLFNDPAIIRLPGLLRYVLARLISSRRAPKAKDIYALMGGRSPILPETQAQAAALKRSLGSDDYKVLISMRYWHPFSTEAARAAKDWGADRVLLLPLYPQFSTTTTASSLRDWRRAASKVGLNVPTAAIGCYPDEPGFIAAQAALLREALEKIETDPEATEQVRILFSAHGLPRSVVRDGDPYQMQVERSVSAVLRQLNRPDLETQICYQSRVGPLEWIGPSTESEVERGARRGAFSWSCRSPSFRSIPRPWSSWISNMPNWPSSMVRRTTSGCRRSARSRNSSPALPA